MEKATAMFDQVDQDGDGELDEHEFIKSLNSSFSFFVFLSQPDLINPIPIQSRHLGWSVLNWSTKTSNADLTWPRLTKTDQD